MFVVVNLRQDAVGFSSKAFTENLFGLGLVFLLLATLFLGHHHRVATDDTQLGRVETIFYQVVGSLFGCRFDIFHIRGFRHQREICADDDKRYDSSHQQCHPRLACLTLHVQGLTHSSHRLVTLLRNIRLCLACHVPVVVGYLRGFEKPRDELTQRVDVATAVNSTLVTNLWGDVILHLLIQLHVVRHTKVE